MYVQVNIGRNVGTEPMSDKRWQDFQLDVVSAINGFQLYVDHKAPAISYEMHTAQGSWDGEFEESVHISAIVETGENRRVMLNGLTHLQSDLKLIATRYEQDAIALIQGSDLMTPAVTIDQI